MLRSFFEKRRTRKVLEKYVTPEAAESIMRGKQPELGPLKATQVEYVLVYVNGENISDLEDNIAKVIDLIVTHNGVVQDIVSGLVIASFINAGPAGGRLKLVATLRNQLGSMLKILHGATEGHLGNLGSKQYRMSYTFVIPQFDQILGRLSGLQFGHCLDVTTEPGNK